MLQSSQTTHARTRPVVLGALLGSRTTFITSMLLPIRRPVSDRGHPQRFERGADRNRARLVAEYPERGTRDGLAHRLRA